MYSLDRCPWCNRIISHDDSCCPRCKIDMNAFRLCFKECEQLVIEISVVSEKDRNNLEYALTQKQRMMRKIVGGDRAREIVDELKKEHPVRFQPIDSDGTMKLLCDKCGRVVYSANTGFLGKPDKCNECGGTLIKIESKFSADRCPRCDKFVSTNDSLCRKCKVDMDKYRQYYKDCERIIIDIQKHSEEESGELEQELSDVQDELQQIVGKVIAECIIEEINKEQDKKQKEISQKNATDQVIDNRLVVKPHSVWSNLAFMRTLYSEMINVAVMLVVMGLMIYLMCVSSEFIPFCSIMEVIGVVVISRRLYILYLKGVEKGVHENSLDEEARREGKRRRIADNQLSEIQQQIERKASEAYAKWRLKLLNYLKPQNHYYRPLEIMEDNPMINEMSDDMIGNKKSCLDRERLEELLQNKKLSDYVEACRLLKNCNLPRRMDKLYTELIGRFLFLQESIDKYDEDYQPDLYLFYDYYIPEVLQLTAIYIEYVDSGIGENILKKTEKGVLDATNKLLVAVNDKIDEIYMFATIEINAKAKTLETLMSQDGHVDPKFKIN